MPALNRDLHGNVPDKSAVALLVVDVVNDFEFEGGELLFAQFRPLADRLRALVERARAAGVPVIYVNDNFGKWQSDLRKLIDHCLGENVRGREIVEMLEPGEEDYFVLKPKHSGFFSTTLDTLLVYLEVETLVLTGVAGNICILFTANDAYMRDYRLVVPSDCTASNSAEENAHALEQMREVLKADIRPSAEVDFEDLKRRRGAGQAHERREIEPSG